MKIISIFTYTLPSYQYVFRVNVIRDLWDVVVQFATVFTAIVSVYLAYRVYIWTKHDSEQQTEQQRKLTMLKTLVLDYRMNLFYEFIEDISSVSKELAIYTTKEQRMQINEKLLVEFSNIRLKFFEILRVVDNRMLYEPSLKILDDLFDYLSETMSQEGVDFTQEVILREKVILPINNASIEVLRVLFKYTGNQ